MLEIRTLIAKTKRTCSNFWYFFERRVCVRFNKRFWSHEKNLKKFSKFFRLEAIGRGGLDSHLESGHSDLDCKIKNSQDYLGPVWSLAWEFPGQNLV